MFFADRNHARSVSYLARCAYLLILLILFGFTANALAEIEILQNGAFEPDNGVQISDSGCSPLDQSCRDAVCFSVDGGDAVHCLDQFPLDVEQQLWEMLIPVKTIGSTEGCGPQLTDYWNNAGARLMAGSSAAEFMAESVGQKLARCFKEWFSPRRLDDVVEDIDDLPPHLHGVPLSPFIRAQRECAAAVGKWMRKCHDGHQYARPPFNFTLCVACTGVLTTMCMFTRGFTDGPVDFWLRGQAKGCAGVIRTIDTGDIWPDGPPAMIPNSFPLR